MAHHKRKGPKSTRSGCLLCKPHKRQGVKAAGKARFGDLRRLQKFAVAGEEAKARTETP